MWEWTTARKNCDLRGLFLSYSSSAFHKMSCSRMVPSHISDPKFQPHSQWINKMGLKLQLAPGSFMVKAKVRLCYWSQMQCYWEIHTWASTTLYNHIKLHGQGKEHFQLFQACTVFYSTSAHSLQKCGCNPWLNVVITQKNVSASSGELLVQSDLKIWSCTLSC